MSRPPRQHARQGAHCRSLRRQPCVYCGRRRGGTVDHLRPLVRGGDWSRWNLVPACERCNTYKGAMLLTELAVVHRRMVLHAMYVDGFVRAEWCRLTMPPDLRILLERVTGYTEGTPLLGPLRPAAYPSHARRPKVTYLNHAHRRYHRTPRLRRLAQLLGREVLPAPTDEQPAA